MSGTWSFCFYRRTVALQCVSFCGTAKRISPTCTCIPSSPTFPFWSPPSTESSLGCTVGSHQWWEALQSPFTVSTTFCVDSPLPQCWKPPWVHPPHSSSFHCDCDQLDGVTLCTQGGEGRTERRNREKVKEMIREDRLDMAISKREESEMTPEFLMGRLGRKCLFPMSGNTQVYREGQT